MDINNLEQEVANTPKQILVTDEALNYLTETHKWTKFLAIVGIVSVGLIIFLGLFFMFGFNSLQSFIPEEQQEFFPGFGIGLLYILLSAIYIFPLKYLFTFSTSLKNSIENINTDTFTYAMQNLKSFNKFIGIFTIVILSIYALVFIGAFFAASMFM